MKSCSLGLADLQESPEVFLTELVQEAEGKGSQSLAFCVWTEFYMLYVCSIARMGRYEERANCGSRGLAHTLSFRT